MTLIALPAFADNSICMLHDDGQTTAVVDAGDTTTGTAALDARHRTPAAILVTHHHTGVRSAGPIPKEFR